MNRLRTVAAGIVLVILVYVSMRPIGSLPPLGPFLDPTHGVWAVAANAQLPAQATVTIPGLGGSVKVLYDDRGVPHIFANSMADAVRALGYVVARDRLFQLEMQTRAAAGTLTELLGPATLGLDRHMRSLGLAYSAEREFATIDSSSRGARLTIAYAQGVNAWIDAMGPGDLPLEYRLLRATPQRWEPVHTIYLSKRMGYTLAYSTHDWWRLEVQALVGERATDALFPIHSPIQEPIQPGQGGQGSYPKFDRSPLPPPELSAQRVALDRASSSGGAPPAPGWSEAVVGSNNWSVSPSRSASGHALLAGDPHLNLTLPAIWYEAHIVVPGEIDVYGVTIPGVPAIVIGFTRDVAWSFTNTESDVLDLFEEVVDDPERPTRYLLDGQWRPLLLRVERYRGPRGTLFAADTIYHTRRGPMIWRDGRGLSIRWTVLESSGPDEAFFDAPRARSVTEFLEAMEQYQAPPQNMVVADRAGDIAIRSTGWFPLRAGDGRGNRIWNGSTSASDWTGAWPADRYPEVRNPRQGYVASANQEPRDPATDDTYLGVNWESPWRAMRINELLRRDSAVTPDAMRRYQTDPGSARADLFFAAFLRAALAEQRAGRGDAELDEAASLLAEWDRLYTKDNTRAVLFEAAMDELQDRTWDELVPPLSEEVARLRRVATPREAVLARLLNDLESPLWDDRSTPDVVEQRDRILAASLRAALREVRDRYGDPHGDGWRWDQIRHANIYHLLRLPSLSALDLPVQGGPGTLNPVGSSGTYGPSWRMVVELGPEVRAWAIYPGGQSGNPVSPWYTDRLEKWVEGELDPIPFPPTPEDLDSAMVVGVLTLIPNP